MSAAVVGGGVEVVVAAAAVAETDAAHLSSWKYDGDDVPKTKTTAREEAGGVVGDGGCGGYYSYRIDTRSRNWNWKKADVAGCVRWGVKCWNERRRSWL